MRDLETHDEVRGRTPVITGERVLSISFAGTLLATLTLLIFVMSAPRFSPIFHALLVADVPLAGLAVLGLLLTGLAQRRSRLLLTAVAWAGAHACWLAVAVVLLLGVGARLVYRAHPLCMDEYAVWFQSQVFAGGKLTARFPVQWLDRLVPRFFQNTFFLVSRDTGDVASGYWPGFALLMAPFARAGVSWLCNPVLSGMSVLAVMVTARRLAPKRGEVATWAMLLMVASPVFVAMGISYYAMTALMLANLVFTWGFMSGRARDLFWSGMVGALALCMHNPFPHFLFALPWIVWLVSTRGFRWEFLALVAGYVPLTSILGLGWLLLRARLHGIETVASVGSRPGFLKSTLDAISVLQMPDPGVVWMRLAGFIKLWLWAVPGMLVLAAWGAWRYRGSTFVRLFTASALLMYFGYLLAPVDQGHGWGYRYFQPAWATLPLLAALAIAPDSESRERSESVRRVSAALITVALVVLVPAQLFLVRSFIDRQLALLPAEATVTGGPRRLTIIDPRGGFYAQDLIQNDPFLRSPGLRMIGGDAAEDTRFVGSEFPQAIIEARAQAAVVWRLPESAPSRPRSDKTHERDSTLPPSGPN